MILAKGGNFQVRRHKIDAEREGGGSSSSATITARTKTTSSAKAFNEDGTKGEDARTKGPKPTGDHDNALVEVSIRQKEVVKITKK